MARSIATVLAAIVVLWLVRWSFGYVVRGQRPDMASEWKLLQQASAQAFRIVGRLVRLCWRSTKWTG
jgi:hypothetical protein